MSDTIAGPNGTFNISDPDPQSSNAFQDITAVFSATSLVVIGFTVINTLAAFLALVLIMVDNRRAHKTWRISPSNRIPLSLAVAITISHVLFVAKACNGLETFQTADPPKGRKLACKVFNELGFWGKR